MSPSFNSGPSSKPTNSQTAHFNEKSPVHGPVHSPVHSPQSRFCSVPVLKVIDSCYSYERVVAAMVGSVGPPMVNH